ncbi:hypothetical protein AYO20_11606 [Fonsecaea nubica]|uniref:Uncharacterized protein n=1 Tax=Fonsecaea nubica TaxID=856822 RepID=A0A178BRK7_9EURO|nr:hypothetical protein AYO20_11606 [Fonsecaea nubica]OAL19646.1 hypothetical protein AYO20_11606 [Fonsecaea nubica]
MYGAEKEVRNMGEHAPPGVGVQAKKRKMEGTEDGESSSKLPRRRERAPGSNDEAVEGDISRMSGQPEQTGIQEASPLGLSASIPYEAVFPPLPHGHPNYVRRATKEELYAFIGRHPERTYIRHRVLPSYFNTRGWLYCSWVAQELILEWIRARDDLVEAKSPWPKDMISEEIMLNCVLDLKVIVGQYTRLEARVSDPRLQLGGPSKSVKTYSVTMAQKNLDLGHRLLGLEDLYQTEKAERERRDRMLATLHTLLTGNLGKHLTEYVTTMPGSPTADKDRAYAEASKQWLGCMDGEPGNGDMDVGQPSAPSSGADDGPGEDDVCGAEDVPGAADVPGPEDDPGAADVPGKEDVAGAKVLAGKNAMDLSRLLNMPSVSGPPSSDG